MVKVDKNTVINWEGQEYVQRGKRAGWYVGLSIFSLGLVGLSIWLQWWTFTALVVLSAVTLIIYTVRPPRTIHYSLSAKGLTEGGRLYSYEDYRSFGVMKDEERFAIVLMPRKRFSPAIIVYFPEKQGEEIVDMFGLRLPMEDVKLDILDKIVRMLRI